MLLQRPLHEENLWYSYCVYEWWGILELGRKCHPRCMYQPLVGYIVFYLSGACDCTQQPGTRLCIIMSKLFTPNCAHVPVVSLD